MAISTGGLAKSLNLLTPEENSTEDCAIQKAFKVRLKTFIEGQKWIRRPHMLAPSICAQYGWKCISSQLLVCETCLAKLNAGQPNVQSYQAYKACIERMRECLKTAHKKHCPWPITPCPTGYVQMVPMHKEVALKEFKKRFESLLPLEMALPEIKEGTHQKLGLTEEVSASLYKVLHVESSEWSLPAVILAATGWKREFEAKIKMSLSCDCCQRVVSLLLYTSVQDALNKSSCDVSGEKSDEPEEAEAQKEKELKPEDNEEQDKTAQQNESTEEDSSVDPEPPAKHARFKKESLSEFDPLFEHRPWCLWVIESGVHESSSTRDELCTSSWMPGWKLFVKCLLRNTGCSDSPNNSMSPLKEQLNNARNMLDSWNKQLVTKE